jgi:iron complex transport system ATP-binding protein
MVLTTHDIREIGPFITDALVIKGGRVLAAGPVGEVLTSEILGEAFELPLRVERDARGRYSAWLEPSGPSSIA